MLVLPISKAAAYHLLPLVFAPATSILTKPYAMDEFLQAQAFLQALVKKLIASTVDHDYQLLFKSSPFFTRCHSITFFNFPI